MVVCLCCAGLCCAVLPVRENGLNLEQLVQTQRGAQGGLINSQSAGSFLLAFASPSADFADFPSADHRMGVGAVVLQRGCPPLDLRSLRLQGSPAWLSRQTWPVVMVRGGKGEWSGWVGVWPAARTSREQKWRGVRAWESHGCKCRSTRRADRLKLRAECQIFDCGCDSHMSAYFVASHWTYFSLVSLFFFFPTNANQEECWSLHYAAVWSSSMSCHMNISYIILCPVFAYSCWPLYFVVI